MVITDASHASANRCHAPRTWPSGIGISIDSWFFRRDGAKRPSDTSWLGSVAELVFKRKKRIGIR